MNGTGPIHLESTLKSQASHQSKVSMVLEPNPKGLSFRVPKSDPEIFTQWMDEVINGNNKKQVLMSPIPFACGSLKFVVVRNNTGLHKLHPYFTLYLEKPYGVKIAILYG